ncbi:hypothetical protein [Desulforamulus ruminis]|uniref:Uncharacterized protein n=1 Tax=Desulforamulus ruminis (strain ATCC 23193 / DSM 2154 / NCIMB 8452 / DL) TaxID=696281 RepID=F6DMG8_DESRL|nr:hypothetical protein [Desulforamulus ruminis]AEG61729.1 hypothetical protein Desru_3526 [Desulforamulus ruminis DSM 2154]
MYKGDMLFQSLLKYDFNLYRSELDVPSYLEDHFNKYIQDIEEAAAGSNPFLGSDFCSRVLDNISVIQCICDGIVEIAHINRNGRIKDAYENAYTLFASMEPYYLERFSWAGRDGDYYRIRSGDFRIKPGEDSKKKKAKMFHIKDSKRNLIGAYRFSIPGFPCLYLTSGFELGWFESGMPKMFSYCRMHIEESGENALRLIDISNRPVDLLSDIYVWILNAKEDLNKQQNIKEYLLNYIITYPLAAACSIKVKDRGDRFVEEYVIPQMFMNWIRENGGYDGIRYKSSLNTTLVQGMGAVNIALPVKKFRDDGLCESLTSKIAVSDIAYLDVNEDFKKYQQHLHDINDYKNELWMKMVSDTYYCGYKLKLVDICENVYMTYNSIINGNNLNEVLLHQIECLADYIYMFHEYKDSIIKRNIEEVKRMYPTIDETKLQNEISVDIDRFYALVTKVILKHAVFGFSKEALNNFEKI